MATPASRANLKEYALRALGKPVIEINVDDDQLEDRLDEALQYYAQYHYDGIRRTYLKYKLTEDDKTRLKNPNRSSESTTDKKESGVSTTWSEQDNYLVIPESIISIINNTSIISSDCDNGPKDFLENNSRGYSFNNYDEDSFIETFIFANNDKKENLFKKKIQAKKEAKLYSTYNHFTELIKIF